jgi:hypothetical protein
VQIISRVRVLEHGVCGGLHNWDDAVFEVKSEILYRLEFVCDFLSRGIATLLSLAAVRSRSENLRGFMMRRSLGLKLAFV